ncbi:uncharacterized protein AAGF69_001163 [Amazona ochrocephala]
MREASVGLKKNSGSQDVVSRERRLARALGGYGDLVPRGKSVHPRVWNWPGRSVEFLTALAGMMDLRLNEDLSYSPRTTQQCCHSQNNVTVPSDILGEKEK